MSPLRALAVVLCCFVVGSLSQINVHVGELANVLLTVVDGDVLVLDAGVHTLSNNVTVKWGITITTQAKGQTFVSCISGNSGIIFSNGSSVISNLVFMNCDQALKFTLTPNSVVDNCEFINNTLGIHSTTPMTIQDSSFHDSIRAATLDIRNPNKGSYNITRVKVFNIIGDIYSGGITINNNATISDSYFHNNTMRGWGAALYGNGPGFITVRNSYFSMNSAHFGGALFFTRMQLTLDNCTFNNNFGDSGIIYVGYAPMNLTISKTIFTNNRMSGGRAVGPIQIVENSVAVIEDSTFMNNVGTCVSAESSNVTMNRVTIDRTKASAGFFTLSLATISSCTFSNNWDSASGGALQVWNSTVSVTDSSFYNNSAFSDGGALYMKYSNVTGQRLNFTKNYLWADTSTGGGSAFMVTDSKVMFSQIVVDHNGLSGYSKGAVKTNSSDTCALTISDSTFTSNRGQTGGAVFIQQCLVQLQNNTFSLNSATRGAAIATGVAANVTITACSICSNHATQLGGGLYLDSTAPYVHLLDSQISNNTAGSGAGLFQIGSQTVLVENTEISSNRAVLPGDTNGGGAFVQGGATFLNVTFQFNTAIYGGAVSFGNGSNAQVYNSTIRNNTGSYGAGLFGGGGSNFFMQYSSVLGNNALYDGGGLYLASGTAMIHDVSIVQNTASLGGGINAYYAALEVLRGNFVQNKAVMTGGGMYLHGGRADMYVGDTNVYEGNDAQNSANGIFVFNDENFKSVRMQRVRLTTKSDDVDFCCSGVRKNTTEHELCNFPACSNSQCIETFNNCDCPFDGPTITDPAVPILSSTNTTCTCASAGWIGIHDYCQIDVNECALFGNNSLCGVNALCENTPGNYTCACRHGYLGDAFTLCSDINECNYTTGPYAANCSSDAKCTNLEGSFNCSCNVGFFGNGFICQVCPIGYQLVNGSCQDINECLTNNGGCDSHVVCQNTNGSFICPPCPSGMVGNSSINCTRTCGNGICETALGENCVQCPQDCRNDTCNACGDQLCDASIGENCNSCYEDCKSTCGPKKCANECVNGACNVNTGVCDCASTWTGPACDIKAGGIVVITNSSNPTTILSSAERQELIFRIGITRIQELNGDNVVQPIDLAAGDRTYTYAGNITHQGSNLITIWKYSTVLSNKAVVNFTFYQFEEKATIMFADKNLTFLPHTLKFSVNVSSWPFKGATNSLAVVIESSGKGGTACKDGLDTSSDDSNLQWIKVSRNGVSLYGQFVDAAVVDGRNRDIKFRLDKSNNQVSAILPHFWDYAVFDPAYSVLVGGQQTFPDDYGCEDGVDSDGKSTNKNIIIGVVVGVVGGAIILGVALFVFLTVKKKRSMGRMSSKPYELY